MINTTIGKYKIIRLIGEGGMAAVYEAEHEMLGTKVAIKILNPILSANAQIKERFRNEAKLMASLNHQNITKVIDFDEQPQQLSIIIELLEGEDLNEKIKRNGPLSEKEITDVFSQTLSAFQYAHEKGIVHRDIKPSNIFILPDGRVKILDFGIAKLFGQGNEMTQTGTQMGTPIYMSPEQVKADKSIDYRSDIYSLGVTLFFAINGKPPYNSDTDSQFDIFTKIVYEALPDISIPSKFNEIVLKACKKDREERFQSCNAWISEMNNPSSANSSASFKEDNQTRVQQETNEQIRVNNIKQETENSLNPSSKSSTNLPQEKKSKTGLIIGIVAGVILIIILVATSGGDGAQTYEEAIKNGEVDSIPPTEPPSTIITDTLKVSDRKPSDKETSSGISEQEVKVEQKPKLIIQKYRVLNNCDYSNDPNMICIYWIDGVKYNYNSEINLINGNHTIKNYIKDRSDESFEYNDETTFYVDENTSSKIIVDLNCLACPFFYYKNKSAYSYGGELIRNLNSIKKEGLDFTEINKCFVSSDTLKLMIKEEKDETSFLDEIYLKINDSLLVLPKSDNAIINSNILFRDGKYQILKQGSDFEIYFVIPSSIFIESVKIYSYGYYLKNHR